MRICVRKIHGKGKKRVGIPRTHRRFRGLLPKERPEAYTQDTVGMQTNSKQRFIPSSHGGKGAAPPAGGRIHRQRQNQNKTQLRHTQGKRHPRNHASSQSTTHQSSITQATNKRATLVQNQVLKKELDAKW